MRTITMTLFNRPQYTKRVVDHLSKCKGIEKYHLIIFIDPGDSQVIDIASNIRFTTKEVHINKRIMGCNTNIYNAIDAGFKISDYNIHIEDDICPGKDMLQYFEFCDYRYTYDISVLTICAYHKQTCDGYYYDKVFRNPWFTPWGWATWKDRWDEIKPKWGFRVPWDIHLKDSIRKDRFEIRPYLARTQNIGEHQGTHASPEVFIREHYNEFWVDSVGEGIVDNFIEI